MMSEPLDKAQNKFKKVGDVMGNERLDSIVKEIVERVLRVAKETDTFDHGTINFFTVRRETIEIKLRQKLEVFFSELVSESDLDTIIEFKKSDPVRRWNDAVPKAQEKLVHATLAILKEMVKNENPPV